MGNQRGIVVLGATGMLGHKMFQILRGRCKGVLATIRGEGARPPYDQIGWLQGRDVIAGVDAARFGELQALLAKLRPEFIVNCIGIIKQRAEARCAIPSILINALLPHRLGEVAGEWGGRVIHFSTDCVFSGKKGSYLESDLPDPEDLYGRTKWLGEVDRPNVLTLRTSIIGRELAEHRSLLDWFLAREGERVRGYRRVIYSGVTTIQLAATVGEIIEKNLPLAGLYQVASPPISKFDLLHLLRDAYGLKVEIEADDREIRDRSMRADKFQKATGFRVPDWPAMVGEMAADPTPYPSLRPAPTGRRATVSSAHGVTISR